MLTIDTGSWAHSLDDQSPFHAGVAPQVEAALKRQQTAINTVTVTEVPHLLVKDLGPVEGAEKLAAFLGFPFSVVDLDYRSALGAVETKSMMTHDDALKKVDRLEAVGLAA